MTNVLVETMHDVYDAEICVMAYEPPLPDVRLPSFDTQNAIALIISSEKL